MSSSSCDNLEQPGEFWSTSTPRQYNCNANKCTFEVQTEKIKIQARMKVTQKNNQLGMADIKVIQTNVILECKRHKRCVMQQSASKREAIAKEERGKTKQKHNKPRYSVTYLQFEGGATVNNSMKGVD